MASSWLTWLVFIAIKVETLPRRSLRYCDLPTQLKVLVITLWTVCFIVTISPEFISLSSWAGVGNLTLAPMPEVWRGITPAVEVDEPKPLAKEEAEEEEIVELLAEELEDEEADEEGAEFTIAVLVGMEVTAPVEPKVNVCSYG